MFTSRYDCPFCNSTCDVFGDHQVECGENKREFTLMMALRDVLFSSAHVAAIGPRREVPSLIPSSKSRPADFFLPFGPTGSPLHWIYQSFLPCSNFYSIILHPHKDLPSQWKRIESSMLMSRPVGTQRYLLFSY